MITQKQAAEEIGTTERQVRRLLRKLRGKGDQAVIHELRGRQSNRKLPADVEQRAIVILSDPVYRGFGPTLAAEYLAKQHQITVSKETLRQWMIKAGCGRPAGSAWWRCMSGVRGGAAAASWCSGTPATTTGWRVAANGCI